MNMMKNLLSDIIGKIRSTAPANIKSLTRPIHRREKFHDLIELERNRVHRDEQQFSLILIKANQSQIRDRTFIELVKKTSNRVRNIDQIGWFDNAHLGILLPNTTNSGAKIIAQEIFRSNNGAKSSIGYKTISYPDKKNSEKGGELHRKSGFQS